MTKLELLAPAGNTERFKTAIRYGADAVYLGLPAFSLRNLADNFSLETLPETVGYAHDRGVKVFVTVNSFVREAELEPLRETLRLLPGTGADALIVNDPAVISICRREIPQMPLHLSTQANTLNSETAKFWFDQGVKRIVLARELTLDEVKRIRANTPEELELEVFVHGAMCVSYSGRCLLSNYIDGRDSNRGECVQPCRWKYEFREAGKNGEWFGLEEDASGSYILNSRDMCLAPYLKEIADAGVSCIKIEGRMKSILYVATAVNAYRMALSGAPTETVMKELLRLSHRPYTTGFAFRESEKCRESKSGETKSLPLGGKVSAELTNEGYDFYGISKGNFNAVYGQNPGELMEYETGGYTQEAKIAAVVLEYNGEKREALIEQRNNFRLGESLNILAPSDVTRSFTVSAIRTEEGESRDSAPHPKERLWLACPEKLDAGDILRQLSPDD